jgi:PAS domain S-box-containing protein
MARRIEEHEDGGPLGPLAIASAGLVVLGAALAALEPRLLPAVLVVAAATVVLDRRRRAGVGLQIDQIDRLREAELALAGAGTTHAAARQLADHAMALLGAAAASVIIEGIGDTVRVSVGAVGGSVFGAGSRMRLLDDDGVPCGSIAVSARADGRAYTAQQEHILDALADRVSSTLHRLSLFTEVQAERRTLADVVGSSSDGIFSVGVDHAVRSWNPAMGRITGVPSEAALGRPVAEVFRPLDQEGRLHSVRVDEHEVALVQLPRSGTEPMWLTCSWSPLPEGGYVAVVHDDTERKQLQDDKDGWIAQVGHELRTPLTPIKGFLHTLQRREEHLTVADRQRIYEVMLREEQRLEHLVDGLLQATTVNAGAVQVHAVAVPWASVVDDEVDRCRHADPSRPFEIVVDRAVGVVVVDPNLAGGILANLLSNAVKYSPDGSPVEIRARLDDGFVLTTVGDRGPGVAPADRERIFDKLTRTGDHLTRPQQGIGLGLYVARGAAEQLGGALWVEDRPGGGSRFCLRIPRGGPAPPSADAARADEEPERPAPARRRRRALTAAR